jgi:hypothetical protein
MEASGEIQGHDLRMPVVDIFHQQTHLELCAEMRFAGCLQQEAASTVTNTGQPVIGPGDVKPQRELEQFRSLEVGPEYKGLRFDTRGFRWTYFSGSNGPKRLAQTRGAQEATRALRFLRSHSLRQPVGLMP